MASLSLIFMMKFQLMEMPDLKKYLKYSWVLGTLPFLLILPVQSLATPIPAMGSSALVSPSNGFLFHLRGFHLTKGQTNWNYQLGELIPGTTTPEISVRFQSPISNGFLAIKTETLTSPMTVEAYAKKWIRDYSYYGFDVLGAKAFAQGEAQNKTHGYVVDLAHAKKAKQIRQVIFVKEKTAVILTCADDKIQFTNTLVNCNNILKTFSWL